MAVPQQRNEVLRNQSRFKILECLSEQEGLSWSQLRKITGLSKNTLSGRLADLRKEKWILETVERSANRGRPQIVYRIAETKRKKVRQLLKPVKGIHEIERDYATLTSNYRRITGSNFGDGERTQIDWMDVLRKTVLVILQTAVLQNGIDPDTSNISTSEAASAMGRILTSTMSVTQLGSDERYKVKNDLENNRRLVADLSEKYSNVRMDSTKVEKDQTSLTKRSSRKIVKPDSRRI